MAAFHISSIPFPLASIAKAYNLLSWSYVRFMSVSAPPPDLPRYLSTTLPAKTITLFDLITTLCTKRHVRSFLHSVL
jgi:hypothetical protein